jgi:hypothetical protein
MRRDFIAVIAGVAALPLAAHTQQAVPSIEQPNGAALYSQYCSQCHDAADSRAPGRSMLQSMKFDEVLRTLNTGSMASIVRERTNAFAGGVSGYLRAYATGDGRLLWEVDTARGYPTVNGVPARGGAMDGPGPTIVDGMLYANSGYGQWGGFPGNVPLAFEVGRR